MTALTSVREGVEHAGGKLVALTNDQMKTHPLASAGVFVAVGAALGGVLALVLRPRPTLGQHALAELRLSGRALSRAAIEQARWLLARAG